MGRRGRQFGRKMNCQKLCQKGPVFSTQCKPGGVRRDLRAHYETVQNCYSGAFQRESPEDKEKGSAGSEEAAGQKADAMTVQVERKDYTFFSLSSKLRLSTLI